jgi:hypothetical protein
VRDRRHAITVTHACHHVTGAVRANQELTREASSRRWCRTTTRNSAVPIRRPSQGGGETPPPSTFEAPCKPHASLVQAWCNFGVGPMLGALLDDAEIANTGKSGIWVKAKRGHNLGSALYRNFRCLYRFSRCPPGDSRKSHGGFTEPSLTRALTRQGARSSRVAGRIHHLTNTPPLVKELTPLW